jgi:hypothetical protein
MLNKIVECYRVVSPDPKRELIDSRTAAIKDILKAIEKTKEPNFVLSLIIGSSAGYENNTVSSQVAQYLITSIKAHDSSFPQDLSENGNDLRVLSAIVLGEMISQKGKYARVASCFLKTAFGLRAQIPGLHLRKVMDDLKEIANNFIETEGKSVRAADLDFVEQFSETPEATEFKAALESLYEQLDSAMKSIVQQHEIIREESNLLWWLIAGIDNGGLKLSERKPGASMLICGADVANKCIIPPIASLEGVCKKAFELNRTGDDLGKKKIKKIVADWQEDVMQIIVPDDASRKFSKEHPQLLPLSWLCDRLITSRGSVGWESEFSNLTGRGTDISVPAGDWIIQVFREKVAYRVIAEES